MAATTVARGTTATANGATGEAPKKRTRTAKEPNEFGVMATCKRALEKVKPGARARILTYLTSYEWEAPTADASPNQATLPLAGPSGPTAGAAS